MEELEKQNASLSVDLQEGGKINAVVSVDVFGLIDKVVKKTPWKMDDLLWIPLKNALTPLQKTALYFKKFL